VYLVGRKKDIIIRGGENVASGHVESRLLAHPDVAEVAVVGLPHLDLGEEVAAAVVPRTGSTPDPAMLVEFAAAELAHFEVPSRWWIRTEPLPTNAVGKVVKRTIVADWPPA
jgi:long-chain acyl-CoA synthetase